jgi:hypothetical protein
MLMRAGGRSLPATRIDGLRLVALPLALFEAEL